LNFNERLVTLKTKYIGDDEDVLSVLLDVSGNKYIRKGSTGMGATSAILNDMNHNRLVISPNLGMIQSKKDGYYPGQKMFFIYGISTDKWTDVEKQLDAYPLEVIKVNTTPDQIVIIKDKYPRLYEWVLDQPVFIDEAHAFSADAEYRKSFGVFMELVYAEWRACFIMSTATPIYNHLTLPSNILIDHIGIESKHQPARVLHYSDKKQDAFNFITEQTQNNRLVCVFTNNPTLHSKQYGDLISGNLVGESLRIKLQPFGKGDKDFSDPTVIEDSDVLFLSSTHFAGTDIKKDCSILIINEGNHKATTINVNNVVQAYGRGRETVHKALLVSTPPTKNYLPPTLQDVNNGISFYRESIEFYEKQPANNRKSDNKHFTPHGYVNRNLIAQSVLSTIDEYQLYNREVLEDSLATYHFDLRDYQQLQIDIHALGFPNMSFEARIKNLLKLEPSKLFRDYETIKKCIKVQGTGSFNYELTLLYLTSFILQEWKLEFFSDKLDNKVVKPHRFYDEIEEYLRLHTSLDRYCNNEMEAERMDRAKNKFGDWYFGKDSSEDIYEGINMDSLAREWLMLYSIHKLKKNNLTDEQKQAFSFLEIPTDFEHYRNHLLDKRHRVRNTRNAILNEYQKWNYKLSDDEKVDLDTQIKKNYKKLDLLSEKERELIPKNPNNITINKNKLINAIGFLFYQHNYTVKETKKREYNPLTALPRKLRVFIPLRFVECDIVAANAQFTDKILGTSNYNRLYENIAEADGITRYQAKIKYNKYLNNHFKSRSTAKAFYFNQCGYSESKAVELSCLTAKVTKGRYYETMTSYEQTLIDEYQDYLPCASYRFHDAVVIALWEAENYTLPKNLNGYEFRIGFYTDREEYVGKTTEQRIKHSCGFNLVVK
jgi:hypothetical protein